MNTSPVEIQLTPDVLLVAFSFLELRDLLTACQISRETYTCCKNDDSLWKNHADRRFGSQLVESTITLYDGNNNYRAMVMDDNRRGALPTLLGLKPSHWSNNNRSTRFYCCHIPCVKWDRVSRRVQVFFDVIGESDLRHPFTSSIQWLPIDRRRWLRTVRHHPATDCHIDYSYQEPRHRSRCHFQGYVTFPDRIFDSAGTYCFCYASQYLASYMTDYERVPILQIAPDETALSMRAFEREAANGCDNSAANNSGTRSVCFTGHESPLERGSLLDDNDTPGGQGHENGSDENHHAKQVTWFQPRPPF